MKELKYFNICYHSNILDNKFSEYLSSYSNNSFNYDNHEELIDLINTKDIHVVITKYNFELLKQVRVLDKQIQIIAILDQLNDTHLLQSLELTQIKFIHNLNCINDFIDTLKICIKNLDSKTSNIQTLKNDFVYDTYNKILFKKNVLIPLTKKEILFFDFIFKNSNIALSYDNINNEIWNGSMTQDALRSLIKEIRKKTYKELIKNVSGVGYRIDI
ncbi:winged helix-turn-helix domain-containing protein [Arcobacter sp. L]|uniref:winged helix-turn-helix domain-containing protein n=1 Tax=Arcobacter sp. L TaxID=944547 RepID=UPI00022962CD|nr:winged helix-turn-helix domain-containing protein [Arcobacter sp. L]BAK73622.1 two-component response regulator [Arcobacter sp. L]